VPTRPRHQRSYLEPPTVPLTARLASRLPAATLDPEALLMAAEEPERGIHEVARVLDLSALRAADALAIDWWLLGLTMAEVGAWMGRCKQHVSQCVKRACATLRRGA
jgi:hypothetical protein